MRRIYYTGTSLLLLFVGLANIWVHRAPVPGSAEEIEAVKAQLRYLEPRMHAGLGEQLQRMFPEGNAFALVLYGLAQCGIAGRAHDEASHALEEALWAYRQMDAQQVKEPFPLIMEPKYGAFYSGWRNYLLARIIELDTGLVPAELGPEFDVQSRELESAYSASPYPYISSYDGLAWPADNVVAMASLVLHQRLRHVDHRGVVERWVMQVKQRLDGEGCIPHAWNPLMDRIEEGARGSSQSLMGCFLPVIDSALACEQFALYRERFLDSRLGVPMVREFTAGSKGQGDVDSGPVILGAGSSATIVGQGACRMNGDPRAAYALDATIEGFGLSVFRDRKRFVFGLMPIADLFIVWTRTMSLPMSGTPMKPSFTVFHLWSLSLCAMLLSPWLIQGYGMKGSTGKRPVTGRNNPTAP